MLSTSSVNTPARLSLPPGQDLVVISTELAGYRFLAQNVPPQAEVLLLSRGRDGVTAIAQQLATLPPTCRLHLVTPGGAEGLHLGSVALHYDNLPSYARALCLWRSHLTPRAEILIYNGEMARTEAGKLLIDVLHHLTGAAIAACTTPPNAAFPEGRWELDCATSSLSPSLALPLELVNLSFGHRHPPDLRRVAPP
ncbi:DUF4347 domain-containing protein [Leptolyngbya sp. CCNP1308]|uniref:DUF4347 domain-containing protein n=1 Tax=Leptolyngbya sp. CCNP1308 TaxID=3110255 RepID=UPI002B1FE166|nr:DUF4347 domain-containing protein [Leptolyngbya sp. CCNP1308]MEA5448214.1 DUF4347 domain-containing protein [Leptolyngbya sp. CCNP1308]